MFRARRRSAFIPPLVVMGTAVLLSIASSPLALAAPVLAPVCGVGPAVVSNAVTRHGDGAQPVSGQLLSASGEFSGRSLSVSVPGRQALLSLPVESFIAQPRGDALAYTLMIDDTSEVHVIDLATACDQIVAGPTGIVRSAILDATGTNVFVHSVTNPARADAGVTRYALDGSAAQLVVPPLPDDARFGPTFGTLLGWSTDNATLFVQSCGLDQCRTRLLDPAGGTVSTYDTPGQGPIIGLTASHLVTYSNCAGLPCDVLSVDRTSGFQATLAMDAHSASMAVAGNGSDIVRIETAAGTVEVTQ